MPSSLDRALSGLNARSVRIERKAETFPRFSKAAAKLISDTFVRKYTARQKRQKKGGERKQIVSSWSLVDSHLRRRVKWKDSTIIDLIISFLSK